MTSMVLAEGESNILDRNHRIDETMSDVHALLLQEGLSPEAINTLLTSLPQNVFLSFSRDQLAWSTSTILNSDSSSAPVVAIREVGKLGVSELMVHTQDYDGLFAAVTVVIDEIGIFELQKKIWYNSFMKLLNERKILVLTIVREKIIKEVIEKFQLKNVIIFKLGEDTNSCAETIMDSLLK